MFPLKVEVVKPIVVDDSDTNQTEYQQGLVLQQKYHEYESLDQASDALDNKANNILQGSGLIVVLTGALGASGFLMGVPVELARIIIGVSFLAFIFMVLASLLVIAPQTTFFPGTRDWNTAFTEYILVDREESFRRVLKDYMYAVEKMSVVNRRKGIFLRIAAGFFALQVVGLFLVAWWRL
jgi:hypothetical protein